MADGVSAEVRLVVAARADHLCEYCLIGAEDTFFGCHVDHIVSIKHRGETKIEIWHTPAPSAIGLREAISLLCLRERVLWCAFSIREQIGGGIIFS